MKVPYPANDKKHLEDALRKKRATEWFFIFMVLFLAGAVITSIGKLILGLFS